MLRITTNNNPQIITLRLEGRLEGPWVEVLTECWRGALAQMYAQGADFIADDPMTKAIVAEIVSQ
jgi:hypothetical protein